MLKYAYLYAEINIYGDNSGELLVDINIKQNTILPLQYLQSHVPLFLQAPLYFKTGTPQLHYSLEAEIYMVAVVSLVYTHRALTFRVFPDVSIYFLFKKNYHKV